MIRDRGSGRHREPDEEPPSSYPETTPPAYAASHSFTLQAIMELQKSVGQIDAKVDRMIGDLRSQGEKIDKLRIWAAGVIGGGAVVGFLVWVITMWRQQIVAWLSGAG